MGRDHYPRWPLGPRSMLIVAVLVVAAGLPSSAFASSGRLYVAVGDSITAGTGATSGHSFFDLYCAYLESPAGGSRVDRMPANHGSGLQFHSEHADDPR